MGPRAVPAIALGLALSLLPTGAHANEGTIKRYVMPYAAVLGVMLPHFTVHVAGRSGRAVGYGFRLAPVSFFASGSAGEVVFVPFSDFDLAPDPSWPTTHVRASHGTRTLYFPFRDSLEFLGVLAEAGGSVGFGGPSLFTGGGLVFGGKMATIGCSYRHAWGRDENVHSISVEIGLTYPFRMGARQSDD